MVAGWSNRNLRELIFGANKYIAPANFLVTLLKSSIIKNKSLYDITVDDGDLILAFKFSTNESLSWFNRRASCFARASLNTGSLMVPFVRSTGISLSIWLSSTIQTLISSYEISLLNISSLSWLSISGDFDWLTVLRRVLIFSYSISRPSDAADWVPTIANKNPGAICAQLILYRW